jgi:16S rRNA (guanine527-N7)-methyltransferase
MIGIMRLETGSLKQFMNDLIKIVPIKPIFPEKLSIGVQEEVKAAENAIRLVGGRLTGIHAVHSFGPEGQRVAVVVEKVGPTPVEYPRRDGRPNKTPL